MTLLVFVTARNIYYINCFDNEVFAAEELFVISDSVIEPVGFKVSLIVLSCLFDTADNE